MTPYELALWFRGYNKIRYRESVLSISNAWLSATLRRQKRIPPLKTYLPKEPLTKVERKRNLWSNIEGLAAQGVGKVRVTKAKKHD